MPLIKCPDCGREVSDQAPTCPQCGRPLARWPETSPPIVRAKPEDTGLERWGCKYPAIIIIAGLALIILLLSLSGKG